VKGKTMEKSTICLKGGLIKSYQFTDEFYNSNLPICEEFGALYDKMFSGVCSMYSASQKHKDKLLIKLELCEILDRFFDMGVRIWNGFDNKTYKSKIAYHRYIIDYGKNTDTPEKELRDMIVRQLGCV
jgi:hypothetical protein